MGVYPTSCCHSAVLDVAEEASGGAKVGLQPLLSTEHGAKSGPRRTTSQVSEEMSGLPFGLPNRAPTRPKLYGSSSRAKSSSGSSRLVWVSSKSVKLKHTSNRASGRMTVSSSEHRAKSVDHQDQADEYESSVQMYA